MQAYSLSVFITTKVSCTQDSHWGNFNLPSRTWYRCL